jgi:hypothetical protein
MPVAAENTPQKNSVIVQSISPIWLTNKRIAQNWQQPTSSECFASAFAQIGKV